MTRPDPTLHWIGPAERSSLFVEYHRQVRKNGLAVPDLSVTSYGLTEFRIDDPDGNRLWIGQSTSTDDANIPG